MRVEINGKEYIAQEPTGYTLLKFTERYMSTNGEVREDISKADMIIDLIELIFGLPPEEAKKLKWSELQALNEKANEYITLLFSGEDEKK